MIRISLWVFLEGLTETTFPNLNKARGGIEGGREAKEVRRPLTLDLFVASSERIALVGLGDRSFARLPALLRRRFWFTRTHARTSILWQTLPPPRTGERETLLDVRLEGDLCCGCTAGKREGILIGWLVSSVKDKFQPGFKVCSSQSRTGLSVFRSTRRFVLKYKGRRISIKTNSKCNACCILCDEI